MAVYTHRLRQTTVFTCFLLRVTLFLLSGDNVNDSMLNWFKGAREYLTPTLKATHFQERGVLTPEEFVAAGDLLVLKCPTWKWDGGDPEKRKPYLPQDKQLLITRHVPCQERAAALASAANDELVVDDKDVEWTTVGNVKVAAEVATSPECVKADDSAISESDSDIPDIEEWDDEDNLVVDDPAALDGEDIDNGVISSRRYDISITYDKYYQTPRVWLCGRNEKEDVLTQKDILEDIYSDYALKTVTFDPHPHLQGSFASIHPCRHAEMMKRFIDRLAEDGKFVRVDLYLFLFLKFISSVIPTIHYDFTMAMETE